MPHNRTIPCVCHQCGGDFLTSRYELSVGKGIYCGKPCYTASSRDGSAPLIAADGTAKIPLRDRDGSVRAYTTIDAADADWAGRWAWCLSDGYAIRTAREGGRRKIIRLHREILGLVPGDGLEGDHISKDRLDNRRSNLRIVTKRQNPQNQSNRHGSTSQYRGVSWSAAHLKWVARVSSGDKRIHLGYFTDEDEAGRAAQAARLRLLPYATD